jgi:hypothetical protein
VLYLLITYKIALLVTWLLTLFIVNCKFSDFKQRQGQQQYLCKMRCKYDTGVGHEFFSTHLTLLQYDNSAGGQPTLTGGVDT